MADSGTGSETPPSRSDRQLILVVDYSEDAGELYASYFEHLGYRVARMRGVEHALPLLSSRPAAAVVDLGGYSLDECDIARPLRAAAQSEIVIVVVTSHSSEAEMNWHDADGPDVVLAKPCVPSVVARHVRTRLEGASRTVSGFPQALGVSAPAVAASASRPRRSRSLASATPTCTREATHGHDARGRRRSRA